MTDEELDHFYKYEARDMNLWLDHGNEDIVFEHMAKPGWQQIIWFGATGEYKFTNEQIQKFMEVRNSPLVKALK